MIKFSNVSKSFKKHLVLDSVNLTIESGDRVALIGQNGAGKTTLIRILLGEYRCDGVVTVDSHLPRQNRCEVLSKISFVPQLPPPLKMSVGELVNYTSKLFSIKPVHILDIASNLHIDLELIKQQSFFKLSGGQKQKVLIAIALGKQSELLIMDEPAANLDPESREIFFQMLRERPDAIMIMSSHRLDETTTLVNRVVELDKGQIILDQRTANESLSGNCLYCNITALKSDLSFVDMLEKWGFSRTNGELSWSGSVSGSDRLRFMGALSRYSSIVEKMDFQRGD